VDLKKLKKIINLMQDADISEIELEEDEKKIRIVRNKEVPPLQTLIQPIHQSPSAHGAPAGGVVLQQAIDPNAEEDDDMVRVTSPMVGTFYVSPTPDAPAYVRVGDIVKKGDVVCIIEAMKLMNEIESDVDGKVVSVLVKNAQPVEYGQALYLIDPQ